MTQADLYAPGVHVRANGRLVVYDAQVERGFADAVRRLGQFVRARARKLSKGDSEYAKDLEQAAWIKLWELDPLRFDLHNSEDQRFLRAVLAHRMRDVARGKRRAEARVELVPLHLKLA